MNYWVEVYTRGQWWVLDGFHTHHMARVGLSLTTTFLDARIMHWNGYRWVRVDGERKCN